MATASASRREITGRNSLSSALGVVATGAGGGIAGPRGARSLLRGGWAPSGRAASVAASRERVRSTPPPAPAPVATTPGGTRIATGVSRVSISRRAQGRGSAGAPGGGARKGEAERGEKLAQ